MRSLYFRCCCTCLCWSTCNKHQNKQTNRNHGGARTVLFLVSARIPGQRQAASNEGREARASENHQNLRRKVKNLWTSVVLLNAKTRPAERTFGGVSNRTLKNELQMSVCLTNQREERILLRSAPSRTLEDLEVLTSTALYASSRMESWFFWFNWLQPCRIKQMRSVLRDLHFFQYPQVISKSYQPSNRRKVHAAATLRGYFTGQHRSFQIMRTLQHAQPPAGASRRPTQRSVQRFPLGGVGIYKGLPQAKANIL